MTSALIMMNVTIFALPMSSTHIMFSGLAGASIYAFWSYEYPNSQDSIVDVYWLLKEQLIWILTPIVSVGITIGLYKVIQNQIFKQKDARKRVIKFIPYQVSFTVTLMITVLIIKSVDDLTNVKTIVGVVLAPFLIFFCCIFLTRLYMIMQANSYDRHFTFFTIFTSCLKFWDSTLLIKSYFGSSTTGSKDELLKNIAGDYRD
jgi:phosphate/sulfate permease